MLLRQDIACRLDALRYDRMTPHDRERTSAAIGTDRR